MSKMTPADFELLEACTTREQWNDATTAVRQNHGGAYPEDWWHEMKLSGRMDRILARWGSDSKIRVVDAAGNTISVDP